MEDKPLVWLHEEIQTPPFSEVARIEVGYLLRRLQKGEQLSVPHSRPMSSIGERCHELRIQDSNSTWRIIYQADPDAVVILEIFNFLEEDTNNIPTSNNDLPKEVTPL